MRSSSGIRGRSEGPADRWSGGAAGSESVGARLGLGASATSPNPLASSFLQYESILDPPVGLLLGGGGVVVEAKSMFRTRLSALTDAAGRRPLATTKSSLVSCSQILGLGVS